MRAAPAGGGFAGGVFVSALRAVFWVETTAVLNGRSLERKVDVLLVETFRRGRFGQRFSDGEHGGFRASAREEAGATCPNAARSRGARAKSSGAAAQQAQPQGPVKIELVPTQNDWTKVCPDQVTCSTFRDFSTQAGQPPAMELFITEIKGQDTRLRMMLPVGLLLPPGFRFYVDKGQVQAGNYQICFPNGCMAEAVIKAPTVDQLKKGSILSVVVRKSGECRGDH